MISNLLQFISNQWEEAVVPTLSEYIKIPNKSPLFDPQWSEHGFMQQAVELFAQWAQSQNIKGLSLNVIKTDNKTPIILIDITGQKNGSILFYGHLDKQPEMIGWADDLGPWKPVRKDSRLYGRGSADDGYALFCALTAIASLQHTNTPHPRCIILIEACEESGSYDLPFYMEQEKTRIGTPDLVIGLDSGCGNYDQLWSTTSLRGVITGYLSVDVLSEGVHSGNASGIVPSSFRIIRHLLNRIENEKTGEILVPELYTDIPQERLVQANQAAQILGQHTYTEFPFLSGMQAMHHEPLELILNRTWRPTLSIIGAEGLPQGAQAGNVLRPNTTLKLSFRTPPNCQLDIASKRLKTILEADPP
ncbi:MAG: M20/M25/M40 family metallo-hydrolase, partial [Gammaproteobacteria bacterium]